MTVQSFQTAGFPAMTAYWAALVAYKGETAVVDGPQEELAIVSMALNWTNKVTVDSYRDADLVEHLVVEAA